MATKKSKHSSKKNSTKKKAMNKPSSKSSAQNPAPPIVNNNIVIIHGNGNSININQPEKPQTDEHVNPPQQGSPKQNLFVTMKEFFGVLSPFINFFTKLFDNFSP